MKPPIKPKDYRDRLLAAFEQSVTEHGYAATTIAGIVRHASVSKRTFYEYFDGKEACFLASYEARTQWMLSSIAAARDPSLPWREQLRTSVKVYLAGLQACLPLTRTYLLEIQAVGAQAVELRRKVMGLFSDSLRAQVATLRTRHPELPPLPGGLATAIVGGIEAMVLYSADTGRAARLTDLEEVATAFMCAVVQGQG